MMIVLKEEIAEKNWVIKKYHLGQLGWGESHHVRCLSKVSEQWKMWNRMQKAMHGKHQWHNYGPFVHFLSKFKHVKIELQQSISEHIVFYKFCFMPTGNYQSAFCTKETLKVSLKTLWNLLAEGEV